VKTTSSPPLRPLTRICCSAVPWCSIVAILTSPTPADDRALLEALDAGVQQWREGVNFFGHYVMRRGTADTMEEAIAGRLGDTSGNKVDRLEGVVVKLGDCVRVSGKWRVAGKRDPLSHLDFECAACRGMWFFHDTGLVLSQRGLTVRGRAPGEQDRLGCYDSLDPFSFHGGDWGRPIGRLLHGPQGEAAQPGNIATVETKEREVVVRTVRNIAGKQTVRTLTFSLDYTPPLLVRQESVTSNPDGSTLRSVVYAHKVVGVQGGHMASVLRLAMGPVRAVQGDTAYIYSVWESADLGQRAPTAEDLAVELGPEIEIVGLKNAPPPGKPRRFALNQYTVDDLEPPRDHLQPIMPSRPLENVQPPGRGPLIAVIVGLAAIAASYLLFRLLRRRPGQQP